MRKVRAREMTVKETGASHGAHLKHAIPIKSLAAGTEPRPGLTGEQFVAKLKRVRRTTNGWQCRCPAHDDRTPSLSVAEGVCGVVFHCHAGCTPEDVLGAMGLEWWQLFYWSNAELKRSHDAEVKLHFPDAVHSGALSVERATKWLADWRERRRSFAHRLRTQLPDLDWRLLDAALSYESPAEGMTVAQGRLGAEFGVDQSTVSRHLAPFVEAGVLKSEARSRKGYFAKQAGPGRTSNSYRLDTFAIALILKAALTKAKDVVTRTLWPRGSWGPQEWRAWGEKLMAESPDRVRHGLSPPDTKAESGDERKAFVKQANLSTFRPRNDGSTVRGGSLLRGEYTSSEAWSTRNDSGVSRGSRFA
jgi:DNA-binding transcriptional ArsR family regulator